MTTTSLAVKATLPQLHKRMQTGEAFHAVAASCLAQLADNREGVRAGDGESVHQMRVGLRRWKSACRLFRKVARPPAELVGEIDWLAGVLGAARDWDVLAHATLPEIIEQAGAASPPALPALRDAVLAAARERLDAAAAAAGSARFEELSNKLASWIDDAGLGSPGIAADGGVARFADDALRRDRKRLARRARGLAHADPPARHRLRIAAKKARYDAEFFLSLHDKPEARRYLRRLARLQDTLGHLNDASVAGQLLAQLATTPELALAAGFVQGLMSAGQERGAAKLDRRWRRLADVRMRVPFNGRDGKGAGRGKHKRLQRTVAQH